MKFAKTMIVVVALSGIARVSEGQSQTAAAESLFDDARALLREGKIKEACAAFAASQKLEPRISTMLNLASCHEKEQRLATAWGEFLQAQTMAKEAGDKKNLTVATQHAGRVKALVSKLTIEVPEEARIPGLQIQRSSDTATGETVEAVMWNHSIPVDGGFYTILVTAPKRETWKLAIRVASQRDAQKVVIPILKDPSKKERPPQKVAAPAAPPPRAPALPTPAPATPPPPEKTSSAPTPNPPSEAQTPDKEDPNASKDVKEDIQLDPKCKNANQTYAVILAAPLAEGRRTLRLVDLAMQSSCFATRTREVALIGIKTACKLKEYEHAERIFRKAGSERGLAAQCPEHLGRFINN